MGKNKRVTFECPSELIEAAEREAKNRLTNFSNVCRLAMASFLQTSLQASKKTSRLKAFPEARP